MTMRMKKDTLFKHKEFTVTCIESMGDANEYWKLLEPIKLEKNVRLGRFLDSVMFICILFWINEYSWEFLLLFQFCFPSSFFCMKDILETTWKQARNETFKVHEMEQLY
jgi:hypothetical protein